MSLSVCASRGDDEGQDRADMAGRNRWAKTPEELRECREYALGEVNQVRARGAFKVRVKEGKEH